MAAYQNQQTMVPKTNNVPNAQQQGYVQVPMAQIQQTALQNEKERRQKEEGYAAVVDFMNVADDFLLFRRFGSLNTRALLFLQWQIGEKEKDLQAMDLAVKKHGAQGARNDSFRYDKGSKREFLMKDIVDLLERYNQYLTTYSQIRERASAPDYQLNKLKNWHRNHYGATHYEDDGTYSEIDFLSRRRDVIPLIPKARTAVRWVFENVKVFRRMPLFRAKMRDAAGKDEFTYSISERGFDWFVTFFVVGVGLALLFGPMWWLNFVDDDVNRLGIITGFISVFCILLTISTISRPFEVLGGTAAYAAVLMVFLQVQHGSPGRGSG